MQDIKKPFRERYSELEKNYFYVNSFNDMANVERTFEILKQDIMILQEFAEKCYVHIKETNPNF